MAVPRFFVDQELRPGSQIALPQSAAHHLIHVLRLRKDDDITLFNGAGGQFSATVANIVRSSAIVSIGDFEVIDRESSLVTHLGIAVIRKQAMDAALVRANELGVTEITPLLTERVSVNRRQQSDNHWKNILSGSCEQCGRNRLPVLHPPTLLDDWLRDTTTDVRIVAHPYDSHPSDELPHHAGSASLLIGPEGGLTSDEVQAATSAGFRPISLGPRVLRAETVPAVLLTLAQLRWGDL
jgi:16S rRNA (uracil1498-N3)-methyltransferase